MTRFSPLIAAMVLCACGHIAVSQVALLSDGELSGRRIPAETSGPSVSGEDCSKIGGDAYHLSQSVRDALKGTEYDTILDATVTTTTGALVFSNCVKVTGSGVRSDALPTAEATE